MFQNYAKTVSLFRSNFGFLATFAFGFALLTHLAIPDRLTLICFMVVSVPLAYLLQRSQLTHLRLNQLLNPAQLRGLDLWQKGTKRFLLTCAAFLAIPAALVLWLSLVEASATTHLVILLLACLALVIELTVFGLLLPASIVDIDLTPTEAVERGSETRFQLAWDLLVGWAVYLGLGGIVLFLLALAMSGLLHHSVGQILFNTLLTLAATGLIGLTMVTLCVAWKRSSTSD